MTWTPGEIRTMSREAFSDVRAFWPPFRAVVEALSDEIGGNILVPARRPMGHSEVTARPRDLDSTGDDL